MFPLYCREYAYEPYRTSISIGGCCGSVWNAQIPLTFQVFTSEKEKGEDMLNYTHDVIKIDEEVFLHVYTRTK